MKALVILGVAFVVLAALGITLPTEQPALKPVLASSPLAGDVTCDESISAIDAALVLQLDAGLLTVLPCPENADVNDDGSTNALDASLILQFVAGLKEWLSTPTPTATNSPTNTWQAHKSNKTWEARKTATAGPPTNTPWPPDGTPTATDTPEITPTSAPVAPTNTQVTPTATHTPLKIPTLLIYGQLSSSRPRS